MTKLGRDIKVALKNAINYEKKRKKRMNQVKKDLRKKFKVDVKMGTLETYTTWLEDQYCDLSDIFDGVNEQRLKLIGEKYKDKW